MLLPLLGLFLYGLPLLGAICAGCLRNPIWANCLSVASFIPSFLINVLFFMVAYKERTLSFDDALAGYGITFFLPLALHFGVRFLTRFIRERLSES